VTNFVSKFFVIVNGLCILGNPRAQHSEEMYDSGVTENVCNVVEQIAITKTF